MNVHYWGLSNGTWFAYNGKTFLKLYGGPDSMAYCLNTQTITVFENQEAKVVVLK
jgi:hypothetical protein